MKRTFIFFLVGIILLLAACHPESNDYAGNKLLLIQVSYLTKETKGIKELFFSTNDNTVDTLPIQVSVTGSGDFSNLHLTHLPTGDKIFDGEIIWCGSGSRTFPENMDPPSNFETTSPFPKPENSKMKILYPDPSLLASSHVYVPYAQIWGSISTYSKVKYYMENNCKIGLFLHHASTGVADHGAWNWYIIFYL
jgi:hypothetical protein